MVQWEKFEFPFTKGLDTKTDPKLILPGGLLSLENARFSKLGRIETRPGFLSLPRDIIDSSNTVQDGAALAVLAGELLQIARNRLYSRSQSADGWIDKGAVPAVRIITDQVLRNTGEQKNPDCCTTGGFSLYAWEDSRGGVFIKVIDEDTGVETVSDTAVGVGTGLRPRCFTIGRRLFVVFGDNGDLSVAYIDTTEPSTIVEVAGIEADVETTEEDLRIEVTSSPLGLTSVVCAYTNNGGAIAVLYITRDGSVGLPANGYPNPVTVATDASKGLALLTDQTDRAIYIASADTNAEVSITALYPSLATAIATTLVSASGDVADIPVPLTMAWLASGEIAVFYDLAKSDTLAYNHHVVTTPVTVDLSGGSFTPGPEADVRRSCGLASKAWTNSSGTHVLAVHDSTSATADGLQNTYFVLDSDGAILGKFEGGTAGKLVDGMLPTMVDGTHVVLPIRTQFVSTGNGVGERVTYSLIGLGRADLEFGGRIDTVEYGKGLLIGGGVLGYYDGFSVTEQGFHLFPENFSGVSAAGGALEAGTREFVVVWTWYDDHGQRHQSAASVAIAVVSVLNDKVTLTIPTLRLTEKSSDSAIPRADIVVDVYSTEVDGTVFYRTPNADATDPNLNQLLNDTQADTVTFVRKIADADLIGNEILYTDGGVLDNVGLDGASLLTATKRRAFIAGGTVKGRVFYSKEIVPTNGPEFSDANYFDVDTSGGSLTAVDAMDEKVVLLKEHQIEVVEGEGPDPTGENGTFSLPGLVTTDVGCLSAESLAVTPDGLVFQSKKGIYRLNRSLSAEYIGAPVEDFNGFTVTGAQLVADKNEVWFTLEGSQTLAWNYYFNTWTIHTIDDGQDLVRWGDNLALLQTDGTVLVSDESTYRDGSKLVRLKLVTGWIKPPGSIQGFFRCRRFAVLGDYVSAHKLRVRVRRDFQPFYSETHTFDPLNGAIEVTTFGEDTPFGEPVGGKFGGDSDRVYQFRSRLRHQKCEAVAFELVVQGSTPGAAVSLTGLSLEIGQKQGIFKLRAAKTI